MEILYFGLKSHVIFINSTSLCSRRLMLLVISLFCAIMTLASSVVCTLVFRFVSALTQPVCEFLRISPEAVKSDTNFCLHGQTPSYPLALHSSIYRPEIRQHRWWWIVHWSASSEQSHAGSVCCSSFNICTLMFILPVWTRLYRSTELSAAVFFSHDGSHYIWFMSVLIIVC